MSQFVTLAASIVSIVGLIVAGSGVSPGTSSPAESTEEVTASSVTVQQVNSSGDKSGARATNGPLKILVTNDDGWSHPAINTLFDALTEAGHDVTMVAPLTNQSGMSGRVTMGGTLDVTQQGEGKYSVSGTPTDATEVALSVLFADEAPDLVISGINDGYNLAAATVTSGTVGAAVTALNDQVPAIAISTDSDNDPYFGEVAEFAVDLVDTLQTQAKGGPLLPSGVGLNVNHPALAAEGVRLTNTGTGRFDLVYEGPGMPAENETVTLAPGFTRDVEETVDDADSTAIDEDNMIAISAISPNYDAGRPAKAKLQRIVNALD